MAAQTAAHEAAIAEERRIREEEARRAQAEVQQHMAQMYSFIQGLSVQMGQQLPPMAFPLIPAMAPATPPMRNLTTLVLSFQVLETQRTYRFRLTLTQRLQFTKSSYFDKILNILDCILDNVEIFSHLDNSKKFEMFQITTLSNLIIVLNAIYTLFCRINRRRRMRLSCRRACHRRSPHSS